MIYTRPYAYPDGEVIPTNLPDLYQPQDNPGVPADQNCANCGFYKKGYCSKFDAQVRAYYWCAKWKTQGN
jgi:hypothetical protein